MLQPAPTTLAQPGKQSSRSRYTQKSEEAMDNVTESNCIELMSKVRLKNQIHHIHQIMINKAARDNKKMA